MTIKNNQEKMKKTICFDIDGVICTNTWGSYSQAKPHSNAIKKINDLYESGNTIILFTARFMGRNNESVEKTYIEGYEFTKKQMTDWGVKFHKLMMGKPSYDVVIDDKHFNYSTEWISKL